MAGQSPTQRSLAYCRKLGYVAAVVEKWVPGANIRRDAFGWMDILVLKPETGETLGVQATSTGAAERVAKMKANPDFPAWLACGNKAEVWSWRRVKLKRGGKAVRWELRVVPVTETDE